jgi:hypothetical protein
MGATEKWLLASLGAIAFVGFALAFNSTLERQATIDQAMLIVWR